MDKKTLEPAYGLAPLHPLMEVLGGMLDEDAYGAQWVGTEATQASLATWWSGIVCPLTDLGLIQVEGPEAARFLQSQLTNEVEKQGSDELALNGYCTAKGRLLASASQWVEPERISLLVSRPLAAPLAKRLSMFVLRAKARVHDRSSEHLCLGVAGAAIGEVLSALGTAAPGAGRVSRGPGGLVALGQEPIPVDPSGGRVALGEAPVGIASGGMERALLLVPMRQVAEVWPILIRALKPLPSACWRWSEVLTGQPRITPRTSEHFVPQMVNLDLIGGVSFKKGCYPGQEVVARSHYLGKLKRRMFAGALAADSPLPAPGDDLIAGSGSDPCGEVVLAAQAPGGGVVVLFESQIAEAAGARIGETPLTPIALPYAVPCA